MPVTVSLYNHTAQKFADGSFIPADTYKLKLLTTATFDATHTTLAATGGTEVANGNGYTTGGATLTNVAVTATGNDAKFSADTVTWTATGASLSASNAILYNSTDANSPPVVFIDFGATETAGDGTDFKVIWNAAGIVSFTVA